jgi:hypothetical protein
MDSPSSTSHLRGLPIPPHHPKSNRGDDVDIPGSDGLHWIVGLGVSPGHWAHREPAPHGEPAVQ